MNHSECKLEISTKWSADVYLPALRATVCDFCSTVSSCSQKLCNGYTSDPLHLSVTVITKKLTIPLKDYNKSSKITPNPVGLHYVNHVFNIPAHLAS